VVLTLFVKTLSILPGKILNTLFYMIDNGGTKPGCRSGAKVNPEDTAMVIELRDYLSPSAQRPLAPRTDQPPAKVVPFIQNDAASARALQALASSDLAELSPEDVARLVERVKNLLAENPDQAARIFSELDGRTVARLLNE